VDKRDIAILKETIAILRRRFVKEIRRMQPSRLSPAEKGNIEAEFEKAATSTMMAMLEKESVNRS
jgi:hypothetical protein